MNSKDLCQWDDFGEFLSRPKEGPRDPFWKTACLALLREVLKMSGSQRVLSLEEFHTFLKSASAQEYEDFFKGTEAAAYTSAKNKMSTQAIRIYLSSEIGTFLEIPLFKSSKSEQSSYKKTL